MRVAFPMALLLCGIAAARDVVICRGVTYAEYPGNHVKMTLYLPADAGETPRPAVVLIHGGSWLYGSRAQLDWYGRRLARNGYVAAAIDYRKMPRYGFPCCLYDAKAAVRWLRVHAGQYHIDPGRIGAMGDSAGGHLAALLATTAPEDGFEGPGASGGSSAIQAAVILYGVADLSPYLDPRQYKRFAGLAARYLQDFVTKAQHGAGDPYDAASPMHYAGRNAAPMLLFHGKKDRLVPYGQAQTFTAKLQASGVPARLVMTPFGHAFDFIHWNTRRHVFAETLEFLNQHLGLDAGAAGP